MSVEVIVDIRDIFGETARGDAVRVWSPGVREGSNGLVSSRPQTKPLVDGKATLTLEPGPVNVQFLPIGAAGKTKFEGVVPATGPVTLGEVIAGDFVYTPPVVQAGVQAIWTARDQSLAVVEDAIDDLDTDVAEFKAKADNALTVATAADGKSTTALSKSTTAESAVGNAVSRVVALEAMGGLSPESPVDGQTANLVLQGGTLTGKAIGDAVQGKVVEAVTAPLAPLFLDPTPFGVQSGGPVNVRTGLSTQHGPGGGWVEEMSVPVAGDAGTKTLASPDTATVDGFVTQRWQAAVSTGDRDFFVEVVGTSPGGVIHLRDPLPVSVDGYLSARYDTAPSGQHLTRRGTRAYVEHLLGISPVIAARGPILDGAWTDQPTRVQDLWRKNPALDAAGVYEVTEGGRVVVGVMSTATRNSYDPDFMTPFSLGTQSHVSVGVGAEGQGLVADFDPAGRATVLEFAVGCQRISHPPRKLHSADCGHC